MNDPPVAVDDTASTPQNTPLNLTQANLKGNDTDVDNTNAQLTVTAVSNPTNGTVQLVSGTVTFTPTAGYTGPGRLRLHNQRRNVDRHRSRDSRR